MSALQRTAGAVRERAAVLRYDDFRALLAGRTVSFLGDGLYAVALMWLVYDLTGSTGATGVAGFLSRIPNAGKVAVGPLVDRAPLSRVLVGAELAQAVVVVVVPVAALTGHLSLPLVLATVPLMAIGDVAAAPAQSALLPRLLPDDALVRANSAFAVATEGAQAVARGVAGVLVAAVGAVGLYAVDAATFLVAAACFLPLPSVSRDRDPEPFDLGAYATDLREGVGVLTGSTAGLVLAGSLFAAFLGGASFAVLPAFADGVGGPETYGLLLAGYTVGGVAGSVLAGFLDDRPLGGLCVAGFAAAAALWVGSVLVGGALATVALFSLARVPTGAYNVAVTAVFQTGVPDDLLGRVMAAASSATNLALPLGMLVGGAAGDVLGSRTVMLANGVGLLLTAAFWAVVPSLRRFGPPNSVANGQFAQGVGGSSS